MLIVNATNIGLFSQQGLWVKGDDGVYYQFGVNADGVWSGPLKSSTDPGGINFSGIGLGNAVVILGADNLYHVFKVTGDPGAWTDTEQYSTFALGIATNQAITARFDDGLFVSGADNTFHKFTVVGETWTDSDQGYLLPF